MRKYPFGYQVINGEITISTIEQKIVKKIFEMYLAGKSYTTIANTLSSGEVHYHTDNSKWNKNMVARILQNKNYIDSKKFPPMLSNEIFEKANKKLATKTESTIDETKEFRGMLVCEKCSGKVKRRVTSTGKERWYCENDSGHISTTVTDGTLKKNLVASLNDYEIQDNNTVSIDSQLQITNIHKQMKVQNTDSSVIKQMILEFTASRYSICSDGSENRQKYFLSKLNSGHITKYNLEQIATNLMVCTVGKIIIKGR